MKTPLFIIFSFSFSFLFSQEYEKDYPNEDVITTYISKHIKISNKRGKLNITENVQKTNFFINNNTLSLAKESVNYNTFNTLKSITANTLNNGITSVVTNFTDKDVLINGIFFNDQKKKSFIFPNVKKGSFTTLKYVKEINDPHFLPAFLIAQETPILKGDFTVTVPKNVEIAYKTFNIDTTKTKFNIIQKDKETIYQWSINSVPKISRHYDLSPLFYIPQIIVYIKSFTNKNNTINILSSPRDLYNWYNSLIPKNQYINNELKKITLELIDGLKTDKEKIEKIFYYIQNSINYIAFEDGLNGFVPRDAFQVYSKKYGDCKDMANILNEMLQYANIKSGLTWIGTRSKPYSYYEVPTPFTDNHMITTTFVNGKPIFLDATAKYLTYGLPSPFIQGKEALIGKSNGDFEIIKVPEVDPKKNKTEIKSILTVDTKNLILKGEHTSKLYGYEKLIFLHKLDKNEEKNLSFLYYNLKFGTKKTSFNEVEYDNLNIKNPYLTISYKTETKGYIRKIDDEIYIKPHLDFNLKKELIRKESLKYDKKIDFKFEKEFNTFLTIPKGYIIEKLPKNLTVTNELFSLKISYKFSEDKTKVAIDKQLKVNTLLIKPAQTKEWNNFIKTVNKSNKQNLILKRQ